MDDPNAHCLSWDIEQYDILVDGKKKPILKDIKGYCQSKNLMAIMGPSGAGKSTLLDILAQRRKQTNLQGEILFNGH